MGLGLVVQVIPRSPVVGVLRAEVFIFSNQRLPGAYFKHCCAFTNNFVAASFATDVIALVTRIIDKGESFFRRAL